MALIRAPRTVRLSVGVDMQDHSGHFAPVRPLTFGLQKANVRDDMLFIIGSQRRIARRHIRDVRI
ncbi:hypothetical protein ASG57_34900 [Bradyrhizobium sp. Leaf396]|nr:hypothetical protein ASG57_34900 [Bradyrhizobium sp. Leaf396]